MEKELSLVFIKFMYEKYLGGKVVSASLKYYQIIIILIVQ